MRATITKCRLTVVIVNETKKTMTHTGRETRRGAHIEELPWTWNTWGPALRAGAMTMVQPGVQYTVTKIDKERKQSTSGFIEATIWCLT